MRFSKLSAVGQRKLFDPSDKDDQLELKFFLENNKWKNGCPFYEEYPWENIPAMCKDKYIMYMLAKMK